MRYEVYRWFKAGRLGRRVGQLARRGPTRRLAGRLFGTASRPRLAEGEVRFEALTFRFEAPLSVLRRAQTRGIENRICRLVMAHTEPGGVAIDVGANWGFISIVMASSVGPEGRVLSFEPNPPVHAGLRANLSRNGLLERCRTYEMALDERPGGPPERRGGAVQSIEALGTRRADLDSVVADAGLGRLDVLKIDVDGADLDVLRGAVQTVRRYRPLLIVELSRSVEEIFSLVRQLGYRHLVDMSGRPARVADPPPNLVASDSSVIVPPRGAFT